MAKQWETMQDKEGNFDPNRFTEPDNYIGLLRQMSRAGAADTSRLRREERGRKKIVWKQSDEGMEDWEWDVIDEGLAPSEDRSKSEPPLPPPLRLMSTVELPDAPKQFNAPSTAKTSRGKGKSAKRKKSKSHKSSTTPQPSEFQPKTDDQHLPSFLFPQVTLAPSKDKKVSSKKKSKKSRVRSRALAKTNTLLKAVDGKQDTRTSSLAQPDAIAHGQEPPKLTLAPGAIDLKDFKRAVAGL